MEDLSDLSAEELGLYLEIKEKLSRRLMGYEGFPLIPVVKDSMIVEIEDEFKDWIEGNYEK